MSVKLTDAQLVMLSAAARREDLCLIAPDKLKGAILTKVTETLAKPGLVRVSSQGRDARLAPRRRRAYPPALRTQTGGIDRRIASPAAHWPQEKTAES
jgi:hypothetical protein